jgi:hypothetical protein
MPRTSKTGQPQAAGCHPSSTPLINLYNLRSSRAFNSFVTQCDKSDRLPCAKAFSVRWAGGKTPLILSKGQPDILRVDDGKRQREQESHADGPLQKKPPSSSGTLAPNSAPSALSSPAESGGTHRSVESRGRTPETDSAVSVVSDTALLQQFQRSPAPSGPQSNVVYGQYLTPSGPGTSLSPSVPNTHFLAAPSDCHSNSGQVSVSTSPWDQYDQTDLGTVFAPDSRRDDHEAGDFDFSQVKLDPENEALMNHLLEQTVNDQFSSGSNILPLNHSGHNQHMAGPSTSTTAA